MQDQPRTRPQPGRQLRLTQRMRATLFGMAIALLGLALLLWPHEHPVAPTEGDDIATLARMVNLPAVPLGAHWSVGPLSQADIGRAPGPNDWYIDATLTFAAADAARISGVESFYKSPLLSGKLMRIDDTHLRLILNTQ